MLRPCAFTTVYFVGLKKGELKFGKQVEYTNEENIMMGSTHLVGSKLIELKKLRNN